MNFRVDTLIEFSVGRVFAVLRDRIVDLADFMPDIESIESLERIPLGPGKVRTVHHWQASPRSVPRVARPFISHKILGWHQTVDWEDARHLGTWRVTPARFARLFDCAGVFRLESAAPHQTLHIIEGDLNIALHEVPGLPRKFAGPLKPRVERFILGLLRPNLESLGAGLQRLMDATEPRIRIPLEPE